MHSAAAVTVATLNWALDAPCKLRYISEQRVKPCKDQLVGVAVLVTGIEPEQELQVR